MLAERIGNVNRRSIVRMLLAVWFIIGGIYFVMGGLLRDDRIYLVLGSLWIVVGVSYLLYFNGKIADGKKDQNTRQTQHRRR
jgi:hypothetical protein